jgi:hypothetical protein
VHQHGRERLAGREQQEKRVRPTSEGPVKDHLAVGDDAGLRDRAAVLDQPGQTAECLRISASVLPHPPILPHHAVARTLAPSAMITFSGKRIRRRNRQLLWSTPGRRPPS